jgi:putative ABC transport system permease protein
VAPRDDLAGIQRRERHRLSLDGSKDDFQMIYQAEFFDTLSSITSVLTGFLAAIAGISLVVGGIGIVNICWYRSLSEHARLTCIKR